jgi:hypothetical protein
MMRKISKLISFALGTGGLLYCAGRELRQRMCRDQYVTKAEFDQVKVQAQAALAELSVLKEKFANMQDNGCEETTEERKGSVEE